MEIYYSLTSIFGSSSQSCYIAKAFFLDVMGGPEVGWGWGRGVGTFGSDYNSTFGPIFALLGHMKKSISTLPKSTYPPDPRCPWDGNDSFLLYFWLHILTNSSVMFA